MNELSELERLIEMWTGVRSGTVRSDESLARLVHERVAQLGSSSVAGFVERVRREGLEGEEFRRLIRIVTNGQTYFFRDPRQLVELADHLARTAGARHPHVWVAGCSTGEEAYTLAILCAERGVKVHVHATDLQDERVASAEHGLYGEWALRAVPEAQRLRHFDAVSGGYRIRTSIRNRVSFGVHNLVDERAPTVHGRRVGWDAIVCRNVFIYWAPERVESVCRQLADELGPGGVLVLGPSESLLGMSVPLVPMQLGSRTAYRLPDVVRGHEPPPDVARCPSAEPGLADPQTWVELLNAGHASLLAHDFITASRRYEEATTLAELEPESHFFRGLVHLKLGHWAAARESLRRSTFLQPEFWPAWLLSAGVHERKHDAAAGLRDLRTAAAVVARSRGPHTFRSAVDGIAAATITAEEAVYIIERRVASLGRGVSKEARDG